MRVLVIDDSSLSRRTLRQSLEAAGHSVDEATGGEEGLERFHIGKPELVVLDMVMSGMYGLEVLAKLRQMDPEAKVLIATADIQQTTADEARQLGAVGILNKPVNRDKLTAAVAAISIGGSAWN